MLVFLVLGCADMTELPDRDAVCEDPVQCDDGTWVRECADESGLLRHWDTPDGHLASVWWPPKDCAP